MCELLQFRLREGVYVQNSQSARAVEARLLPDENGQLSLLFGFLIVQSRRLKSDPERPILDFARTMMDFLPSS